MAKVVKGLPGRGRILAMSRLTWSLLYSLTASSGTRSPLALLRAFSSSRVLSVGWWRGPGWASWTRKGVWRCRRPPIRTGPGGPGPRRYKPQRGSPREGSAKAAPVGPPRAALVVAVTYRAQTPAPPGPKVQGDVGGVVPVGVAGAGRAAEVAVKGVQHFPPLQEELLQERPLPVPVALLLGEFRPDPWKR